MLKPKQTIPLTAWWNRKLFWAMQAEAALWVCSLRKGTKFNPKLA
jgi:hypothetical protein